jgi:hypothetical protein
MPGGGKDDYFAIRENRRERGGERKIEGKTERHCLGRGEDR